ncbi:MAG: UDP-N-acetylmuramoyl-L-alanyl-D-glutamate--2,6-diaminopimelate ligase [Thermodesulfobacteriota bacterium]|nr:UDP-N-acetylmuramoyl-L-alanyl-D-glutamate--2,6-diaminopimelate ligase [Thermodesulfobacteriota bacterium]
MKLKKLLERIQPLEILGSSEIVVTGLAYDSRQAQPGTIFFALPGVKVDGVDFIPQALKNGAVAIIAERLPESCSTDICFVRVANARLAMAKMAAGYYGDPTLGVPVIGVTGTNGKTTTTYLLEAILKQAGLSPAVFGTVEYRFKNSCIPAERTTPESIDLMRMMADFREQGADALILEVASHALEQHRVDGIDFDLAVFTNLTPEHLDYHLDMESYFTSKRRLFSELLGDGAAVINSDDSFGRKLLRENSSWISFGLNVEADAHPQQVEVGRDGIHGIFNCTDENLVIESEMIGDFNVSNLLAAVAAAHQLGIGSDSIAKGIAAAPQVPGRVEKIKNDRGILALVDYSHGSDALEQVLKTLTKLESRWLVTVFGCGGDRDQGKRPVMGALAIRYSDLAILTSDNPRTEDPLAILEQIRAGAVNAGGQELSKAEAVAEKEGFIVIPDRRSAIEFAAHLTQEGDLLLVTGKGHEDYQILGTKKIHFDDREELYRVLNDKSTKREIGTDHHV